MSQQIEHARILAGLTGVTVSQADTVIRGYLASRLAELRLEGRTRLPGIGVLVLVKRKPKTGRNPRTGEQVMIPAKVGVKYRQSESLVL